MRRFLSDWKWKKFAMLLACSAEMMHAQDPAQVPLAPRTALVYDDVFLEHGTTPGFPESPDRLRRLTAHLKEHEISKRLLWQPPDAKIDPMPWILAVHKKDYISEF